MSLLVSVLFYCVGLSLDSLCVYWCKMIVDGGMLSFWWDVHRLHVRGYHAGFFLVVP